MKQKVSLQIPNLWWCAGIQIPHLFRAAVTFRRVSRPICRSHTIEAVRHLPKSSPQTQFPTLIPLSLSPPLPTRRHRRSRSLGLLRAADRRRGLRFRASPLLTAPDPHPHRWLGMGIGEGGICSVPRSISSPGSRLLVWDGGIVANCFSSWWCYRRRGGRNLLVCWTTACFPSTMSRCASLLWERKRATPCDVSACVQVGG